MSFLVEMVSSIARGDDMVSVAAGHGSHFTSPGGASRPLGSCVETWCAMRGRDDASCSGPNKQDGLATSRRFYTGATGEGE